MSPVTTTNTMKIRAFNIIPGLVLDLPTDDEDPPVPCVVLDVFERNSEYETITFQVRNTVDGEVFAVDSNYCEPVTVIGTSVNPHNPDDTDYGSDLAK